MKSSKHRAFFLLKKGPLCSLHLPIAAVIFVSFLYLYFSRWLAQSTSCIFQTA